jgi:hypothetical protein
MMKKLISLLCLSLALSTLLCACDEPEIEQPADTVEETKTVETEIETVKPSETEAPAEKNSAYVNFEGEVVATPTRLEYMDIPVFKSVAGKNYKYQWTQGGCVVGNLVYTCMITDDNTKPTKGCIIVKDLESGEVIKKSGELELGHANDVAYNPDQNVLAVADCNDGNLVYIVDPDTLKVKKTIVLDEYIYSLAYDDVSNKYIGVGLGYIRYYTSNFKYIKGVKFSLTEGHAGQGILCDGTYIYMLEYRQNLEIATDAINNNLAVYRMDTGAKVTLIDLGINRETEFIGWNDGYFYIGCNNIKWTGMEFYKVEIAPK